MDRLHQNLIIMNRILTNNAVSVKVQSFFGKATDWTDLLKELTAGTDFFEEVAGWTDHFEEASDVQYSAADNRR